MTTKSKNAKRLPLGSQSHSDYFNCVIQLNEGNPPASITAAESPENRLNAASAFPSSSSLHCEVIAQGIASRLALSWA